MYARIHPKRGSRVSGAEPPTAWDWLGAYTAMKTNEQVSGVGVVRQVICVQYVEYVVSYMQLLYAVILFLF